MTTETHLRGILEVATAILLGLVAVATAAGAYQASEWSRQSGAYANMAGELRDESLATGIASRLSSYDDNVRVTEAINLGWDIEEGGPDVDALIERQQVVLEGGSPGLAVAWERWIEADQAPDAFPLVDPEFLADQLAPTYGANRASAVAFGLSDDIGDRSLQITVASAVFALALLLLGVSGANRSLKVAFSLAVGGAATFVIGVVISLLAVVG
jgi:hypothetical protein